MTGTHEHDVDIPPCPFEGPEKLLEIWFAPSAEHVRRELCTAKSGNSGDVVLRGDDGKFGLRVVERKVWDDLLDIVKCKVLNVVYGEEMDAYLLSESSLFVSPHRLILKTCGTTLNLLGLPRILHIAATHAVPPLPKVHRCFYSRKAFMFPERQLGPHREWGMEVQFLDGIFKENGGSAYTVGRVNGDHWLLYLTHPVPDLDDRALDGAARSGENTGFNSLTSSVSSLALRDERWSVVSPLRSGALAASYLGRYELPPAPPMEQDYTIEILMTHLSARARAAFFTPSTVSCGDDLSDSGCELEMHMERPSSYAVKLSDELGISTIFPRKSTTFDAYSFTPCGYSANALINWDDTAGTMSSGEGYYTIHVTPEEGWSYASFECNIPLSTARRRKGQEHGDTEDGIPDLHALVRRVVRIFEPGKLTLTLFVSASDGTGASDEDGTQSEVDDDGDSESYADAAQRVFKAALTRSTKPRRARRVGEASAANGGGGGGGGGGSYDDRQGTCCKDRVYKRTDKINYEFEGYDLAFASFELM